MRLPGVCISCREPVVWNGKHWRAPGQWGRAHVCQVACGALMPLALERCARRPGHTTPHRSRYAMDNECRAKGSQRPMAGVQ
jgi:hypothetical protein